MLVFRLLMNVDTVAFLPSEEIRAHETARILRAIADRLMTVQGSNYTDSHGGFIGHYQTIFDKHGNDIGRYAFKPE